MPHCMVLAYYFIVFLTENDRKLLKMYVLPSSLKYLSFNDYTFPS